MNVKVGNKDVVAGDYSTYEGLRVGVLARHTYNDKFLAFVKEKGFPCEIKYYDTPTELTSALVNDEVDALVNCYIGIPEDERTVENFGQTPYYIMARKADQSLIDEIDSAIDSMNIETPNWRTELYNEYYGSENQNTEFTEEEQKLLNKLQEENVTIRAVLNPDAASYSWYEDGEAKGIVADMFRATAKELNLDYEIVPVENKKEYEELIKNGDVDIWMNLDGSYEDEKGCKYKITEPYLTTTMIEYLFDHPVYLVMAIVFVCLLLFVLVLYLMSVRSKNKQKKIAEELAVALEEAKEANDSKQNFFSKMSHDIRTLLNVVLGMTQIAQKYKHDVGRLENALNNSIDIFKTSGRKEGTGINGGM